MLHPKLQEIVDRVRATVSGQGRRFKMRVRNHHDVMVTCPTHWDTIPSLHITVANNGTIMFYCFAGCKYHSVIDSIGFQPNFGNASLNGHIGKHGKLTRCIAMKEIARYTYVDENNVPIFHMVRYEPKRFATVWASEDIKSVWNDTKPFYNMPGLLSAQEDDVIIYSEGEKDAHTLMELGCISTCTPHGASMSLHKMKWSFIHNLPCRNYLITWDYDVPGVCYAIRLLAHLTIFARAIGLITVSGPYGSDITDYRDKCGDDAAIKAINTAISEMITIDSDDETPIEEDTRIRNIVFLRLVPMILTHTCHVTQSHLVSKYAVSVSRVLKKYGEEARIHILKRESEFQKLVSMVTTSGGKQTDVCSGTQIT